VLRPPDPSRRVVITGLGIVSPVGNDAKTTWYNVIEGHSGLGRITKFDVSKYAYQVGGEVKGFNVYDYMDYRDARRTDTTVHYSVATAKQALTDAGFDITAENRDDVGVVFGTVGGCQQLFFDTYSQWRDRGPKIVSPVTVANGQVDAGSGAIAIATGARGHNFCPSAACSSGTVAVGEAAELIRRGDCTAVIAGSAESPLIELLHVSFMNMRGLGKPLDGEPDETASRPFDATRNGFVVGEGGAALLLEDLELAKARGARIYAEVLGYAAASDACDMVIPACRGEGVGRAIRRALLRARIPADEVGMINPHGTATAVGDQREAEAFWDVFGAHTPEIQISATKSIMGHPQGASGSIEAALTALSLYNGIVPGTLNYRNPDGALNVTVAAETQDRPLRYALSDNVGLGGHNAALVLGRYAGD
jgi:3-oxoacyl-[acyl-carrier-protein] synthase II